MSVSAATCTPAELAEAITGRPYLSWSQVQSYLLCPRAFAYRYVERAEPQFTSSSLVFGSALHEAISMHNEARLEGRPTPQIELLREVVRDELTPVGPPVKFNDGEDIDTLISLAERMLAAFFGADEGCMQSEHPIICIEESVTAPVDDALPPIQGRIDLVELAHEGVVITDYKSTKSAWPAGKAEEHAGQLHLYARLVADKFDERDRIASLRFITITKGKSPKVQSHPLKLNPARLDATIEQMREVWRGIVAGVFPARPGWPCRSCPFQEQCDSAAV